MRRRRAVILVGVCALLGVATTVLSSWVIQCAYMRVSGGITNSNNRNRVLLEAGRAWGVTMWHSLGRRRYLLLPFDPDSILSGDPALRDLDGAALRQLGLSAEVPRWVPREGGEGDETLITAEAYGWPMVSLRGESRICVSPTKPANTSRGEWQVVPRAWHGRTDPTGLNLIPVWPGFAVNTVFFAAVWGAVLVGVPAAVRARRWGKGRCPGCGYDLRGQVEVGCPECGEGRGEGNGQMAKG